MVNSCEPEALATEVIVTSSVLLLIETFAKLTDEGDKVYDRIWLISSAGIKPGVIVTCCAASKSSFKVRSPLVVKIGASLTALTVSVNVCEYELYCD